MSERIQINVGGKVFEKLGQRPNFQKFGSEASNIIETYRETIMKYPDTMLARYLKEWSKDGSTPFFDRNATLFEFILDFYRNGCHSFPQDLSVEDYNKELDFWGLPRVEVEEETPETHETPLYISRYLLLNSDGGNYRIISVVKSLYDTGNQFIQFRSTGEQIIGPYSYPSIPGYTIDEWKQILPYFFPRLEYATHHPDTMDVIDATTEGIFRRVRIDNKSIPNDADYVIEQRSRVFCSIFQIKLPYKVPACPWLARLHKQ